MRNSNSVALDTALIDLPRQMRRLPDTLDAQEVAALLEATGGHDLMGLRDRALLELLYAAGLRVSEALSLDRGDLDAAMIQPGDLTAITVERARRALAAGADGVIASPHEAAAIRALPEAAGRLIVTPGVRPAGADHGDQKRVATPAEALSAGADHVVIGRPILGAPDPAQAAKDILASLP